MVIRERQAGCLGCEVRDSHWMMAYGDHLKELAYATRKIGIRLTDLSQA